MFASKVMLPPKNDDIEKLGSRKVFMISVEARLPVFSMAWTNVRRLL